MLLIYFYVPEEYLQAVKNAMFQAGAGKVGDYQECCWQVKGQGQYRPMPGSQAFIGSTGELSELDEYRVEMVCEASQKQSVISAMIHAHPYEEVAYGVMEIQQ